MYVYVVGNALSITPCSNLCLVFEMDSLARSINRER
jgi:hypothetical protein